MPTSADPNGVLRGAPDAFTDPLWQCLPYQLSMVVSVPTMVTKDNMESGFDSGAGAWEMATTAKEGSRHTHYPLPNCVGLVKLL